MVKKIQTEEDIQKNERIDALVKAYQEGEVGAAEELLEVFYPMINKYMNIMRGTIKLYDMPTRKFMNLFIPDAALRKRLKQRTIGVLTIDSYLYNVSYFTELLQDISDEDMRHSFQLSFLILADKFVKKKVPFRGYIAHTYKYEVYKWIKAYISDPLTYCNGSLIVEYVDDEYDGGSTFGDEIYHGEMLLSIPYEEFDINWIYGRTCSDTFKDFSVFDRTILRKNFYENMTDGEIAQELGYHINTINGRKRKAITRLRKSQGRPM